MSKFSKFQSSILAAISAFAFSVICIGAALGPDVAASTSLFI